MKTYIYHKVNLIVAIIFFSIASFSCETEGDSVGISGVTYFPTFELTEGEQVVLTTGSSFTPSVVVKEGDTELTPTINNPVDAANPAVFDVVYAAENSDGYTGSTSQRVIVYNPAIVPTDVTGNIADIGRPERKGVISLVPGTTNIFFCTDMGFAGEFPLYFQMDGDVMTVIPQPLVFGAESVDATYDPVTKQFAILINPQGFDYNFQYE